MTHPTLIHITNIERNEIAPVVQNSSAAAMSRKFKARFIEPGLVRYSDTGTVLVNKKALDGMMESFDGKPVFNENHMDNGPDDFSSGRATGRVTRTWYDPEDAWYWCEFWTEDPATIKNCESGKYYVSCAYNVKQWGERQGVHNNIPYENEVLAGEYVHLAIVPNPRYEGARIIYNSNGGNMKLAFWKKEDKSEVRNASEIDSATATIEIDGSPVKVIEMIDRWNASEAKKKADADALKNKLTDDDQIEVGGKKVSVKDLKAHYIANAKKNDDEDDEETEEEKKKRKAKEAAEKADDKKENDSDDDDEDSDDEKEKKKKKKEEDDERKNTLENEKRRAGKEGFDKLKNANASKNGQFVAPNLMTPEQRIEEGRRRYGSGQ